MLLAFGLLVSVGSGCTVSAPSILPNVDADSSTPGARARALVAAGAVLLDVRTKAEFAVARLQGAKNIPISELKSRLSELEPYHDSGIVVHCLSGGRSARAKQILQHAGFKQVIDIGTMSAYRK